MQPPPGRQLSSQSLVQSRRPRRRVLVGREGFWDGWVGSRVSLLIMQAILQDKISFIRRFRAIALRVVRLPDRTARCERCRSSPLPRHPRAPRGCPGLAVVRCLGKDRHSDLRDDAARRSAAHSLSCLRPLPMRHLRTGHKCRTCMKSRASLIREEATVTDATEMVDDVIAFPEWWGSLWRDHRQVIDAIPRKLRTGTPWHDLPKRDRSCGGPRTNGCGSGRWTAPGSASWTR